MTLCQNGPVACYFMLHFYYKPLLLYHLKSKYLSDYHNIAHAFYYQSVIIIFVIMEILWTKLTDTYTQVVWVKVLLFIGFFACQTTRKM